MGELHQFLIENHSSILTLSFLWAILGFGYLLWRRKQSGLSVPKTSNEDIVFVERFVSGYSHRSWITQIGGASKCLTIIVTDSHLVITSFFPFTAFMGIYDLEHSVQISKIIDLVCKDEEAEIQFKRIDDTVCKLTLRIKDPIGFKDALQNKLKR